MYNPDLDSNSSATVNQNTYPAISMHRQSIEHRVDERTPTPPPTHESSFVSDWPISSIPFTPYVFAGSKGGVLAGNMKDLGLYNVYDGSSVASSAVDSNGEVTTIGVSGCGTFVFTGSR